MSDIMVVPLDESTLSDGSLLLAQYKFGAEWSSRDRLECKENLGNLIKTDHAYCLLAYLDDVPAGLLSYSWGFSTTKGLSILRVQDLFTAPKARTKGVGKALLQYVKQVAQGKGAHRVQLETDHDNTPARMLYEVMGFECISQKIVYMLPLQGWHRSNINSNTMEG